MIAEMSAAIASGQHFNNKMNKDDKSFNKKQTNTHDYQLMVLREC